MVKSHRSVSVSEEQALAIDKLQVQGLRNSNRGLVVGIGGPLFTAWISPSEEEIRAKYNPELRQRSIDGKAAREAEFNEFVLKLKEYSKSDKPSAFNT